MLDEQFNRLAKLASQAAGHPAAFGLAVIAVLAWAISGPFFGFSDTWQLVINTATTILTCLMVFLIQNTQNRDAAAVQIKLDELIRVVAGAHNRLLDLEELSEADLQRIRGAYLKLAEEARQALREGREDTSPAEVEPPIGAEPATEAAGPGR
jgi:low affinity Fe/Cu permease